MNKPLSIITAVDEEKTQTLFSFFKNKGDVSLVGKAEDRQELCNMIDALNPDLVIIDLVLPEVNGIEVLSDYHWKENAPSFIAVNDGTNSKLSDEAINQGAKYVMVKPFLPEDLYGRMKLLTRCKPYSNGEKDSNSVQKVKKPVHYIFRKSENDSQIEYEIMKALYQIGIPSSVKGFHYIKDAVFMVLVEPDSIMAITKAIYPAIAFKYFTSKMNVERAIRHAFTISWERGSPEGKAKVFGKGFTGRIKNAEAISMIASKVEYTLRLRNLHA
jgi:two-component system response regulator (stage 0 sporulation protein A)